MRFLLTACFSFFPLTINYLTISLRKRRVFSTTRPQAWNQLSADIRKTATYGTRLSKIIAKTLIFNVAYEF